MLPRCRAHHPQAAEIEQVVLSSQPWESWSRNFITTRLPRRHIRLPCTGWQGKAVKHPWRPSSRICSRCHQNCCFQRAPRVAWSLVTGQAQVSREMGPILPRTIWGKATHMHPAFQAGDHNCPPLGHPIIGRVPAAASYHHNASVSQSVLANDFLAARLQVRQKVITGWTAT